MSFLLGANVLLALGYTKHRAHQRVGAWVAALRTAGDASFATCAITELAFVRVGAAAGYFVDVAMARKALAALKASKSATFTVIPDALGADAWRTPFRLGQAAWNRIGDIGHRYSRGIYHPCGQHMRGKGRSCGSLRCPSSVSSVDRRECKDPDAAALQSSG